MASVPPLLETNSTIHKWDGRCFEGISNIIFQLSSLRWMELILLKASFCDAVNLGITGCVSRAPS